MTTKKPATKSIQDVIDRGATTVEKVHKSIAELPMKMLEQSDLLRGPAKEVRRVQEHTISAIYDLIRDINKEVGTLTSDLLAKAGARSTARSGAGAKKGAAVRHATR